MRIIKTSIISIDDENSSFFKISEKLSGAYTVGITARIFKYESNHNIDTFDLRSFKDLFYDWEKIAAPSDGKIYGMIELSNFENSRHIISLCFNNENSQRSIQEIIIGEDSFWNEVAKNFTLPPSDVYIYEPDYGSFFTFGVYWQFCHIYLNRNTQEGIILYCYSID